MHTYKLLVKLEKAFGEGVSNASKKYLMTLNEIRHLVLGN